MEAIWQDNVSSTLDLKHLFTNMPPPDCSNQNASKADKLAGDSLPDFSLAYLGPQLWSNTVMSDDLKLEPITLDDLLDDGPTATELLDICSLVSNDTQQDAQHEEAIKPAQRPEVGAQGLTLPQTSYDELHVPALNYGSEIPVTPQVPETPTAAQHQSTFPSQDQASQDVAGITVGKTFSYEPDITDIVISSSVNEVQSNSGLFDPSKRVFTDEELKPQPIIRKAKKVYVPAESKDAKYWQKREKNNTAAKRSREARRIKENQIAMRTKFLEKENDTLRNDVQELREEVKRLMKVIEGYQAREAK